MPKPSLTQASHREAEALRRENGELRRHLREAEVTFFSLFDAHPFLNT